MAHGHGWYGFALTPDAARESGDGLRRAADDTERPAELGDLEISVTPRRPLDAPAEEAFAAAGVHRLVPNIIGAQSPPAPEQRLQAAADVIR